eukprot:CAMPEP_0184741210 /NCGR_PEP_ID=MMETSP0315-20130426/4274_1 /TAXON_ID=101924 /ORGANISM="Rhodosorus marinus, Strain UTEX LB 2760" /LENGTH=283 /DNA_ID=CAMNT_0027211391 /DNA_START=101 /DNA_END=952 /DNA_ORIENTATION=-
MEKLIEKFESGATVENGKAANPAAAAPTPPAAAAAAAAPPPPPPPPPPPNTAELQKQSAAENAGSGALFAEINSLGEGGVRSGLKKATRGPVNEDPAAPALKPAQSAAAVPVVAPAKPAPAAKTPTLELKGKKWVVEFFEGNNEIILDVNNIKESVYIYRCNKSTIQIKGKCNSIAIDSCKKFNCVFESALSICEVVNSSDIQIQSTGASPAVTVDNCNTLTYYLSAEALADAQIITSKSAAVNLCAPKPDDPDDMFETPIPEQMVTKFKDGQWVTEFVDHSD